MSVLRLEPPAPVRRILPTRMGRPPDDPDRSRIHHNPADLPTSGGKNDALGHPTSGGAAVVTDGIAHRAAQPAKCWSTPFTEYTRATMTLSPQ